MKKEFGLIIVFILGVMLLFLLGNFYPTGNVVSEVSGDLISNGDFSNGLTGWGINDANAVAVNNRKLELTGYGFAYQDVGEFIDCTSLDKKFRISFDINVEEGMRGILMIQDHVTWSGNRYLTFDSSLSGHQDIEFDCRDWLNSRNTHMITLATSGEGNRGKVTFDNVELVEIRDYDWGTCKDSDGDDIYTKGICTDFLGGFKIEHPEINDPSNRGIWETTCVDNLCSAELRTCENGFVNGACIQSENNSCSDDDSLDDVYTFGKCIDFVGGQEIWHDDGCEITAPQRVWQASCGESGMCESSFVLCPSGEVCSEGICISENNVPVGNETEIIGEGEILVTIEVGTFEEDIPLDIPIKIYNKDAFEVQNFTSGPEGEIEIFLNSGNYTFYVGEWGAGDYIPQKESVEIEDETYLSFYLWERGESKGNPKLMGVFPSGIACIPDGQEMTFSLGGEGFDEFTEVYLDEVLLNDKDGVKIEVFSEDNIEVIFDADVVKDYLPESKLIKDSSGSYNYFDYDLVEMVEYQNVKESHSFSVSKNEENYSDPINPIESKIEKGFWEKFIDFFTISGNAIGNDKGQGTVMTFEDCEKLKEENNEGKSKIFKCGDKSQAYIPKLKSVTYEEINLGTLENPINSNFCLYMGATKTTTSMGCVKETDYIYTKKVVKKVGKKYGSWGRLTLEVVGLGTPVTFGAEIIINLVRDDDSAIKLLALFFIGSDQKKTTTRTKEFVECGGGNYLTKDSRITGGKTYSSTIELKDSSTCSPGSNDINCYDINIEEINEDSKKILKGKIESIKNYILSILLPGETEFEEFCYYSSRKKSFSDKSAGSESTGKTTQKIKTCSIPDSEIKGTQSRTVSNFYESKKDPNLKCQCTTKVYSIDGCNPDGTIETINTPEDCVCNYPNQFWAAFNNRGIAI